MILTVCKCIWQVTTAWKTESNAAKNTDFHLISWYGNIVERHSFFIVSGDNYMNEEK